ncbi:hypothetical protein QOT17_015039 [Balamuthia mandrillaris]
MEEETAAATGRLEGGEQRWPQTSTEEERAARQGNEGQGTGGPKSPLHGRTFRFDEDVAFSPRTRGELRRALTGKHFVLPTSTRPRRNTLSGTGPSEITSVASSKLKEDCTPALEPLLKQSSKKKPPPDNTARNCYLFLFVVFAVFSSLLIPESLLNDKASPNQLTCPKPTAHWVTELKNHLLSSPLQPKADNNHSNLQALLDALQTREESLSRSSSSSSVANKPFTLLFSSRDAPYMWHVVQQIAKARFPSTSFSSVPLLLSQHKEQKGEQEEGWAVLLNEMGREEISQALQKCPYALFVVDVDNLYTTTTTTTNNNNNNTTTPKSLNEMVTTLFEGEDVDEVEQQTKKKTMVKRKKIMRDVILVLLSSVGQEELSMAGGEKKEEMERVVRVAAEREWGLAVVQTISQVIIL